MIDWSTVLIAIEHQPIPSDTVVRIAANGEIDWQSKCSVQVEGSHDSNVYVKSQGGDGHGVATHLYIDGNPSKFLQGHNVFGSNDLRMLVWAMITRVVSKLDLHLTIDEQLAIGRGEYDLKRVDINCMFQLPNLVSVRSWLQAAELKSKTRHGRAVAAKSTVYWGKNSRRWSIKAYSKFDEIISGGKGHTLPAIFDCTPLKKFSENKLRVELTLRAMELKKLGLDRGRNWNEQVVMDTYKTYLGRLDMCNNAVLPDSKVLELPRKVQATYMLWKQGANLKQILPRTTYHYHRKGLLEHGIDISFTCDTPDKSNVVPLLQVLEAKPVDTPDWAYDKGLVYNDNTLLRRVSGDDFKIPDTPIMNDKNVFEFTQGLGL